MIISHKYKFIFLKTRKTAGTSIEMWLSSVCSPADVITPIEPREMGHVPRNYECFFNPFPESSKLLYAMDRPLHSLKRTMGDWVRRRRFYNHIPGRLAKARVAPEIWDSYWKWCVERDPEEKVLSDYYMQRAISSDHLSLDHYLESFPLPKNSSIYCDIDGMPLVDEIVDFKNLEMGLQGVAERLDIPFSTLDYQAKSNYGRSQNRERIHLNSSQRSTVLEEFSEEVKLITAWRARQATKGFS